MNRPNSIALGLSALVLGAVASTASSSPNAAPSPAPSGRGRTLPPSLARHAFAARDGVQVRSAPSNDASVDGTFGLGSGFLVGPETIPGWFPIVREWVDGTMRVTRDLGYLDAADVTFTDPRTVTIAVASSPPRAIGASPSPALGRTDGGECDQLTHFFGWPKGVDDFKARLDTLFSSTDRSIRECPSLSRSQRDEWAIFLAQWKKFAATPTATFGSHEDWVTTCTYSKTLDGWRDVLATTQCAVVGPTTIHGYEVPASAENTLASLATIVKWGALIIGGSVLIATFYPEIKGGLSALRASRSQRK